MKRFFLLSVVILVSNCFAFSQDEMPSKSRSVSFTAGAKGFLFPFNLNTSMNYGYFQRAAPAFGFSYEFTKQRHYSWAVDISYSVFNCRRDTQVVYEQKHSSDTSWLIKYCDLQGKVTVATFGFEWRKNFAGESVLKLYYIVGLGFLSKHYDYILGTKIYKSTGLSYFVFPPRSVFSLNVRCGIGLRQRLSERWTIYEQGNLSYMLFNNGGPETGFSPLHYPLEFLFSFNMGLTYQIK